MGPQPLSAALAAVCVAALFRPKAGQAFSPDASPNNSAAGALLDDSLRVSVVDVGLLVVAAVLATFAFASRATGDAFPGGAKGKRPALKLPATLGADDSGYVNNPGDEPQSPHLPACGLGTPPPQPTALSRQGSDGGHQHGRHGSDASGASPRLRSTEGDDLDGFFDGSAVCMASDLEQIIHSLLELVDDSKKESKGARAKKRDHVKVLSDVIGQLRAYTTDTDMLTPHVRIINDKLIQGQLESFGASRAPPQGSKCNKLSLVDKGAERVARYMTIKEQLELDTDADEPGGEALPGRRLSWGSMGEKDRELSKSLEDSYDGYNMPLSPTKLVRTAVVPLWQRGLNKVKIDSVELASWGFDPFEACGIEPDLFGSDLWEDDKVSGVAFAMRMLEDHGLFDSVNVRRDAMKKYLRRIEREYPRNPYHNRIHALDVMQSCHCVLMQSPALKVHLDGIETLALLLGAYVHDVGHPGVNNKLLITLADTPGAGLRPDLAQHAVTYSNHSVLEFFHLATAFRLSHESQESGATNPFAELSREDFSRLRQLMIELILATDMEQHFSLVTKLRVVAGGEGLLDFSDASNKLVMLKAVIHACDVGNPAKPTKTSKKWTHVISEEFWRQGELEASLGLQSDKMHVRIDLSTAQGREQQANGQLAFIKFIVKPLHEVLALQLPVFKEEAMHWLNVNSQYFQMVKKECANSTAEGGDK